jgi:2-methylisocitrate lyase-like PEP mutase family enzyme
LGDQYLIVEEDIQNFLEAGADLVLAKPSKLEQFDAFFAFLAHWKQMKALMVSTVFGAVWN